MMAITFQNECTSGTIIKLSCDVNVRSMEALYVICDICAGSLLP